MSGKMILFIKGIVFFVLGLVFVSLGLPSDEVDATLQTGHETLGALEKSSTSPVVSQTISDSQQALLIVGSLMSLVGLVELIALGVAAFR